MIKNTNDGTAAKPRLKFYLNLGNLFDLRPGARWPGLQGRAMLDKLAQDGFDGVQLMSGVADPIPGSPIGVCAADRINTAAEAYDITAKYAGKGHDCLTVHAGWGIEDDDDVFRLVEAILSASQRMWLPIYIETHRATITQDIWRTVQITKRFPEVRFNGDFSHYYTGHELVYGGMEMKYSFMAPIFERVRFMHARIGSPGNIQVSIGNGESCPPQAYGATNFLVDHKEIWTRAMTGFLHTAQPGDYMIFSPELLGGEHYYARKFPNARGDLEEESDRYQQALLYNEIACDCFTEALHRLAGM